jgi:hypothetical protein
MATAIQTVPSQTSLVFGEKRDIEALANRIKIMAPGGKKLNTDEAMALSQVSYLTGLNPFIGEIWYIPGNGPMVGIRGARRYGNEQVKNEGGIDAFWYPVFTTCSPEEAGAPANVDVALAYRCELHDSVSTKQYQKMLTETIKEFREGGAPDPFGEAVKVVGPKPLWVGWGYSVTTESSKMNKGALARKRAEADAIKRRFYIPFGAGVSEYEDRGEVVDAGAWDADFVEQHNAPSPEAVASQPVTQTVTTRPYTPEILKVRIMEISREKQKQNKLNATQPQRNLVAAVMNDCFAGDPDHDNIRHSVMKYLTGYTSVKDTTAEPGMPGTFVLALLDWLKPEKDSGGAYSADKVAVQEAHAVWTEALKDEGQLVLEGTEA